MSSGRAASRILWFILGCLFALGFVYVSQDQLAPAPPPPLPPRECFQEPPKEEKPASPVLPDYPRVTVEQQLQTFYKTSSFGAPGGREFALYVHEPARDQWTSAEIARQGTWQSPATSALVDFVTILRNTTRPFPQPIRFLDIGANLGFISLWVASVDDKVVAESIEPHPAHSAAFMRALDHNENAHLKGRITLHRFALSDGSDSGFLCMKVHPTNAAQTFIDRSLPDSDLPCSYVPVTTVDDLLVTPGSKQSRTRLYRAVDLVKIDVEGFEPLSLLGGEKSLFDAPSPPGLVLSEYDPALITNAFSGSSRWSSLARSYSLDGKGCPKDSKCHVDPRAYLVWMFRKGYGRIVEMYTGREFRDERELKAFFQWDQYKEHVPSGHTDLSFYFTGKRRW